MKSTAVLIILAFLNVDFVVCENREFSMLSCKKMLKHFKAFDRNIYIKNYAMDKKFVETFLKENSLIETPLKLDFKNVSQRDGDKISESAIINFDSFDSLKEFNRKVKLTNRFPKLLQFIVHCENMTVSEVKQLDNSEILPFQYFLVEQEDSIALLTFVWYTAQQCNTTQLIEVNRFEKQTKTWRNLIFAINKFDNFYGCRLGFGVSNRSPAFAFRPGHYGEGKFVFWGFNKYIITELAENLNYTFSLNPFINHWGEYFYADLPVDFLIQFYSLTSFVREQSDHFITRPYVFKNNLLAKPPGVPITGYEKLYLPFDFMTWICIATFFASAYLVIFVLSFTNVNIRRFVIGRDVKTPSLNVTGTLFGISQTILPRRNFARFLLTLFIILCLVLRTAWQGKMFDFLQKDMRHPEVQSIEEMIEKNFTFYMLKNFKDHFKDSDLVRR